MIGNGTDTSGERLVLQSRLSELSRISPWIELLASRYSIPGNTRFAMILCLEEVLSNVIRHGYWGTGDHSVAVQFANPKAGNFILVVEDDAPPFNPAEGPELPALSPLDLENDRVGGQGIRLLRRFANSLEYAATPTGNRLSIGFIAPDSANPEN